VIMSKDSDNKAGATTYEDVEAIVDAILDRLGNEIVVGSPLGIGKPNHILNELVERALEDPDIDLEIWTALSLSKPEPESELERRLVEPIAERVFGSYPNLTYAKLLEKEELPENIDVHEFYYAPGQYTNNPTAQQNYHSVNYTHALRTFRNADPNLLLQQVGIGEIDGETHYNIATNTDLTNDLIDSMQKARESGERDTMIVGQVNREMPFMYGDAPLPADDFDAVLDDEAYDFPLFAPPNEPVSLAEQAIGLRVSSLFKDGGTLQIGIGSLGDAIGWATELRQTENDAYRELIDALDVIEQSGGLVEELGGLGEFEEGLYGSTEMFVEAFLELYEAGVLSREVYDDPEIQRLDNDGHFEDGIDLDTLDKLQSAGAIGEKLDEADVAYLKEWGIFTDDVAYDDGTLTVDGEDIPADLSDDDAREAVSARVLGDSLENGHVLHGGFFMGSTDFYEGLRQLDETRRKKLAMTSVQFTNALYGSEELKRLQRNDARFVNTGMKATVTGGVASDGLADGRVISGVGGQFNFVNQAQELDGGRSILMIRAVRQGSDGPESNIVWNYGHITVPRHLRDIIVTEYGVADLRGKSDAEVIAEMIKVADSRFQKKLTKKAKEAGKLPQDWEVPEQYQNNYPKTIEDVLSPFRREGIIPKFPYGIDLTDEELHLAAALENLQAAVQGDGRLPDISLDGIRTALRPPEEAMPYLERMGLDSPRGPKEFAYQRAVVLALAESEFI